MNEGNRPASLDSRLQDQKYISVDSELAGHTVRFEHRSRLRGLDIVNNHSPKGVV
jgi:hypothetical protein